MSTLEEHDAEQAMITAACEAGECDHPECHETHDTYDNECVTRSAPRWAWEIIDETLAMDATSKAFAKDLRESIALASAAMGHACETGADYVADTDLDVTEDDI